MSESNSWADQWLKAQQQFVGAWSDMANSGTASDTTSQSGLWADSFELWRKACAGQTQPEVQTALNKCFDMGKEYFTMAEQVTRNLSEGSNPVQSVNQWMEQLKQSLQQMSSMPGFNSTNAGEFMKQWFTPGDSWQQMVNTMTPINQAMWQFPGMNTSVFNLGETIDPLGKILESPGIGYFREPQGKQQKAVQLAIEYNEANFKFNQAFLRVATESIQGFQQRLLKMDAGSVPKSLREIYNLWVEVSEEHYAEFAMSDEYQSLYGDMVNRLMTLRKHYSEMADDMLRALNLPNTREVDTMQERLQQLRRETIELKSEIREIKSMLATAPPATRKTPTRAKAAAKKAPVKKKAAVRKAKAGA